MSDEPSELTEEQLLSELQRLDDWFFESVEHGVYFQEWAQTVLPSERHLWSPGAGELYGFRDILISQSTPTGKSTSKLDDLDINVLEGYLRILKHHTEKLTTQVIAELQSDPAYFARFSLAICQAKRSSDRPKHHDVDEVMGLAHGQTQKILRMNQALAETYKARWSGESFDFLDETKVFCSLMRVEGSCPSRATIAAEYWQTFRKGRTRDQILADLTVLFETELKFEEQLSRLSLFYQNGRGEGQDKIWETESEKWCKKYAGFKDAVGDSINEQLSQDFKSLFHPG